MSKSGKNGRAIVSGNNGKNREEARARSLANLKPFKPGQSGNPLGRPVRKLFTTALERYLAKPIPGDKQHRTLLEKLVETTVKRALKKSDTLMKEIVERLDGAVVREESPENVGARVILMDKIPRPDREQFYHDNGNEDDE
jgi:Family of unknown function (DUF5681)